MSEQVNASLMHQVESLTAIVKKQQEQLEQLSEMPNHLGTVLAVNKKSVVVEEKGALVEVERPKDLDLTTGCSVRLNTFSQIVDLTAFPSSGVESNVLRVIDRQTVIVESPEGEILIPSGGLTLTPGDSVLLTRARSAVIRKLPSAVVAPQIKALTWSDIGGNAQAKAAMIEAIEWPTRMRHLYAKFKKSPLKGVMLYGPPGNGKTMLAKAASTALATIHGVEGRNSFFSVKGPEVLSKWVGEAEATMRKLFATAKRHSQQNGFPSVIFIDEADSLLSTRGRGYHTYTDTIVNQFLVEMDGIEESGSLVILATNRHDMLDPAVVREGRVDRKVEVPRPTLADAIEIAGIHLRSIPVEGITRAEAGTLIGEKTCERAKGSISGAMLAGVVDRSTSNAIHRAQKGTVTGVSESDIINAVSELEAA